MTAGKFVYDQLSSFIDFLIPTIRKVPEKISRALKFRPYLGPEIERVPEAYIKQIGMYQAEIAKRDKIIKQLRAELELLKEKKRKQLIEAIERRRKQLLSKRKEDTMIIRPSSLKEPIRVLSREGKMLGWFYGFSIRNNLIGIVVTTRRDGKGRKYLVHEAHSIKDLIHNSETFGHQMNVARTIILTRTYDGTWVPDYEVIYPMYPGVMIGDKFRCPYCGKLYGFEELVSHLRKAHGVTSLDKFDKVVNRELIENLFGGGGGEKKTSG